MSLKKKKKEYRATLVRKITEIENLIRQDTEDYTQFLEDYGAPSAFAHWDGGMSEQDYGYLDGLKSSLAYFDGIFA